MNSVQLREAKARLSELIAAAENGEPTTITKHGKPAAVLVSVEDARRLNPYTGLSLGELLLSMPGLIEIDRDQTPMREIEL